MALHFAVVIALGIAAAFAGLAMPEPRPRLPALSKPTED